MATQPLAVPASDGCDDLAEKGVDLARGAPDIATRAQQFVDVQPGLNIAGWMARESWIKQHPQAVAAFKSTLQRAMDLLEDPDERKKAILKFTRLKAGLLSRIKLDKWTTKLDPRDLEKQMVIYKRHGMIDKLYDVNTLIAR